MFGDIIAGPRKRFSSSIVRQVFRFAPRAYHFWYYHNTVWGNTKWLGIPTLKSVSDMWNYQEIIFERRPSLIIEFGTRFGGSALFFSSIMGSIGHSFRVLSVDISHADASDRTKADKNIELLELSSSDHRVAVRIAELRKNFPGPVFAILDSDHSKQHVLNEMNLLRPLLMPGDYLIVEDSNINGHPVLGSFGPGPYEAMEEYFRSYPNDYIRDVKAEGKFGFTFAPKGFLVRQ
jgi:cephalosporin hydroxylase